MIQKLPVTLVLDNIRSAYNVGSIWRTAEVVGVGRLIFTGITPHPPAPNDSRLPHVAERNARDIRKTALNAEDSLGFEYYLDINQAISDLRDSNYQICALEQDGRAVNLFEFKPDFPLVLILGHERRGVTTDLLDQVNHIIEIPQFGQKESLNVSVAAGIALFQLRQQFGA